MRHDVVRGGMSQRPTFKLLPTTEDDSHGSGGGIGINGHMYK